MLASRQRSNWTSGATWSVCLLVFCGCRSEHTSPVGGESAIPLVRVAKPSTQTITNYVYFTGRLDAVESVDVRARVTGYLVEVKFKPGQEVTAGQPLFKIDPRPYKASADQAHAQIKLSEASLKRAISDYRRGLELAKTPGAITGQDLDKYAAAQAESEASVESHKASAEAADLNLNFTDITSPIDGIVGRNLLTVGNLVTQDSTLLTTIVSQDPIYAYFDIDEHTMLAIQQQIREGKLKSAREDGNEVHVQMGLSNEGDEFPHDGVIDFVDNRVASGTGTIQVRARFANPKSPNSPARLFTPGLFVRIRVSASAPHPALLVPQAALSTDQGQKYLLVVGEGDVVEYRPVVAGSVQPGGVQEVTPMMLIREGDGVRPASRDEQGFPSLTAEDRVIVSGLQRVRPGVKVNPQPLAKADNQ